MWYIVVALITAWLTMGGCICAIAVMLNRGENIKTNGVAAVAGVLFWPLFMNFDFNMWFDGTICWRHTP